MRLRAVKDVFATMWLDLRFQSLNIVINGDARLPWCHAEESDSYSLVELFTERRLSSLIWVNLSLSRTDSDISGKIHAYQVSAPLKLDESVLVPYSKVPHLAESQVAQSLEHVEFRLGIVTSFRRSNHLDYFKLIERLKHHFVGLVGWLGMTHRGVLFVVSILSLSVLGFLFSKLYFRLGLHLLLKPLLIDIR